MLAWHIGVGKVAEFFSMSAKNGLFKPFEDEELSSHLNMNSMKSLQYYDMSNSVWVTVLRSSPPLPIKPNVTVHFKEPKTTVAIDDIILQGNPTGTHTTEITYNRRCTVPELDTKPTNDSRANSPATPCKLRTGTHWKDDPIGSRPTRLSKFPGRTVHDVVVRLEWMDKNKGRGKLSDRYSTVYRCPFHSSTFHRHHSAWKWLKSSGKLTDDTMTKLWRDILKMTPTPVGTALASSDTFDGDDPLGVIDLTKEVREGSQEHTDDAQTPPTRSVKLEVPPSLPRTASTETLI